MLQGLGVCAEDGRKVSFVEVVPTNACDNLDETVQVLTNSLTLAHTCQCSCDTHHQGRAFVDIPHYYWRHSIHDHTVTIRTLLPEDQDIESAFVRNLSDESRFSRFHGAMRELTPEMLRRFTHMDYPLEMALIATIPEDSLEMQIGVARYVTVNIDEPAEIAVVVADDWQGRGIATLLLTHLRNSAVDAGIKDLYASVLADNSRMLALARHLGFSFQAGKGDYRVRQLGKIIRQDESEDNE